MSVNFYTGANNITVKNTLTDELKTSYDEAVELVNKLGSDATVEGSVAQRLAAIVANAPEKYDTLKEIATWIESDTDGAAKMQADISTLEADKLDKSSVSSWAKASTKPDYTASEINLANGTSVESAVSTLNSNISRYGSEEAFVSFTYFGDYWWCSSPIPLMNASDLTIIISDDLKNVTDNRTTSIPSTYFEIRKNKDFFYILTNDQSTAGHTFNTLLPNRMWIIKYEILKLSA